MKFKIKLITLLAFSVIGLSSCLDKYPEGAIPADEAINTVSDVNQAVLGIYAGFKSSALYSGAMTTCPEIQADLLYGVEGYSNKYGDFWRWEVKANSVEVTAVYGALYTIIGRCNFVLDYESRVRENTVDDKLLEQLDEYLGEIYFARALAYSELIKMFCKAYDPLTADKNLGVVLNTSYLNPAPKKRATLKESYQFVLNDLKKAEELITQETYPNGVASDFFTKSVVNALYARVYLYMQDWDNAIVYSTKVIDDPSLQLANVTTAITSTQNAYQYMWTNDISSEVIWRVNFTLTSYGGALGRPFLNYDYVSFRPDYIPAIWALNLYEIGDLRHKAFFSTQTTGYSHHLTWPLLIKYMGNESFVSKRILHVNMPKVFRLSEQYLIRAEAYCNIKNFGLAAKDITSIRVKRILNYGSANISESKWLETISQERVRELFMEGFRLHDLKRWGQGFERKAQPNTVTEGNQLKIEANNALFVWPIPQHELNVPGTQVLPNESNR